MPRSPDEGASEPVVAGPVSEATALVRHLARVLPQPGAALGVDPAFGQLAEPPRESAVLLPLYQRAGVPHLLFTLRAPTLAHHSGQISFPGGSRDADDANTVATALREAHEEVGLIPEDVRVLGVLSPVFTVVSNFLISPVVGWIEREPLRLRLNPHEVSELIEVPLHALSNPATFHEEVWQRASHAVTVYFYDHGPYRIWGATARIVHDFLDVLNRGPD
jgi:8-oxo-dGTP pyrophosphatase MutT (NUDIX family)